MTLSKKLLNNIEGIFYEKRTFNLDKRNTKYKPKNNPNKIFYKCKYNRKNELFNY